MTPPDPTRDPAPDSTPDSTPIGSRSEFQAAVRDALGEAATVGCRELWLVDVDFADWPLGEPAVVASMRAWARPHRKLVVIAQHYDALARRHPRWVEFRRNWSHVVECHANTELEAGKFPCLLYAPERLLLRRFDPARHRGSVVRDAASLVRARETLDAVLQRSTLAFPATVLGV